MSVHQASKIEVASDSAEMPYTLSPSPASTIQPVAKDIGNVLVDYKQQDYRGFIFVVHEEHGMVLLKCTRKKNKGPHFQVPGGHVDEPEFLEAGKQRFDFLQTAKRCPKIGQSMPTSVSNLHVKLVLTLFHLFHFMFIFFKKKAQKFNDRSSQLLQACRSGAARELYEETGMDVRKCLERLEVADVMDGGNETLKNEYKHRLFFYLWVNDEDFLQNGGGVAPLGTEGRHLRVSLVVSSLSVDSFQIASVLTPTISYSLCHLQLKLSVEHSGFTFQPEPEEAVEMLKQHSGGKVSEALHMAIKRSLGAEMREKREQSLRDLDPSHIHEVKPGHSRGLGSLEVPPKKEKKGWLCCFN